MSALKTFTVISLSLFLFLCLFIFGWLFSTKMTALNAGYVTSHLDSLPIAEIIDETDFGDDFEDNPQLVELIKTTVTENEAGFKLRTGELIDSVYDYLHGRSQQLDLALVLKDTVLDPDFAISIVNQADLAPLAEELINDMLADVELPYNLSVEPHIEDLARDTESWLKQQAAVIIPPVIDYILGFSQQADIVIPVEDLRQDIKEILKQDFLNTVPAEFADLSPLELEQKFDEIFNEIAGDIPVEFNISTEYLQSDTQAEFAQSLQDTEEALTESRRYIGIFNLVYGLLIGFILLLIGGIVLLFRQVKASTFTLGIVFLVYGFVNIIIVSVSRSIATSQIAQAIQDADVQLSAAFQQWATQLATSAIAPLLVLAIVLFIIGAILLAASFFYPRYKSQHQTETPL
jgi:hypothetical protein